MADVSEKHSAPLRILAIADLRQGSDGYAYIRAFRRLGHSVLVVPSEHYVPNDWRNRALRAARRAFEPFLVREYTAALINAARQLRPDLFFVFKGRYVTPAAVRGVRATGAMAVNLYPDVSFTAHGKYLPRALPLYDWIFQTKTFGIEDLRRALGVTRVSFLPPSFDPEVHYPVALAADERRSLASDLAFIGTYSPKKEALVRAVIAAVPRARLRIWGLQWERAAAALAPCIEEQPIFGVEYAKALVAAKINLGLLSEARSGASSGDLITARTFQIPATGAFMLHERTAELELYFAPEKECGTFDGAAELSQQVKRYLENDALRETIAAAGRARSLASGYAVDARAAQVLEKVRELATQRRTQ